MARSLDPRTPVIVGVGQLNQRVDRGDPALEPVDLIAEAARRADADTGAAGLLAKVDSVRVVCLLSWRYRDPGALVAGRVGVTPRSTVYTTAGGQTPQALVSRTCLDILAGNTDVALIGGAEAWRTRMSTRAAGNRPPWTSQPDDVAPTEMFGGELDMSHPAELARGLMMPVQFYPMFESALRAESRRSVDEHLDRISRLWARFSEVAAANPDAWIQQAYEPEYIRTPGPENRMIGFPYPKLMNSNNSVEQAAALIVCSVEAAEAAGVSGDRWVFPLAGADAHDTYYVSNRQDLHSSPAIRAAGRALFDLAGKGVDDVAHVDLYSCFPAAVQVGAAELGLSVDDAISGSRPLTVTGGLSFAGGPWNNYVTHAIAAMVNVLRQHPGDIGLCSANGGYLTKHALGLYCTEPPASDFKWTDAQDDADRLTAVREVADDYAGTGTIEACTVMHDRDGAAERAFAAVRLADGRRAWGASSDGDLCKAMTVDEFVGRSAQLAADGTFTSG